MSQHVERFIQKFPSSSFIIPVNLLYLLLLFPESSTAGLFKVEIISQNNRFLGETEILYIDIVEEVAQQALERKPVMVMFLRAAAEALEQTSGGSSCNTASSTSAGKFMSPTRHLEEILNRVTPVWQQVV